MQAPARIHPFCLFPTAVPELSLLTDGAATKEHLHPSSGSEIPGWPKIVGALGSQTRVPRLVGHGM